MAVDRALTWYLRLPYPGKVAAATLRGTRLRAWRYGRASEALVQAALERDRWPEARWRSWQQEQLTTMLRHAAATVAPYRAWFADHPDHDPGVLASWPVLSKSAVRADPRAYIADDAPRRRFVDQTSGTSGTPLQVHSSREALRRWFALLEARNRRWHGVSRHDRWAILGGQMIARPRRSRPPYWVWNLALGQLYLSSHNLSPSTAADYAAVLRRYAPTHLVVYSSAAAHLAKVGLDAGERAHGPRVVLANAEPVTPGQRELIEAYFGCPVRETYGMAEMAGAASECEAGRLHLMSDAGVVEVVDDDDEPVGPGESGRLLLTGLVNPTMPLVRYDIGDRGRLPRTGVDCPCGRTLPVLPPIEGRAQDMLVTPAGGRQFWNNPVFYGLPVVEAQVVQERIDLVRVLVVPADGYGPMVAGTIVRRLRDRLGDVRVEVETRAAIERGPNGKFRPVITLVG